MPLYEYKCEGCDEVFEIQQKFADEPLTVHDKCGGRVERLISAPALQFKGSGWYVTDYARNGSASKKSDSESKSTSDTTSKSADSKPASSDKTKTD